MTYNNTNDLIGRVVNVINHQDQDTPLEPKQRGITLVYADGTRVTLEGVGYDGLWTDVVWACTRATTPPMVLDTTRELVSIERAATLMGISKRTMYNWIAGQKVEVVRNAGGALRVYTDTLLRPAELDGRRRYNERRVP